MAKTHYDVLGVSPTATAREIKREYRALAQKLHPDQPTGNEAEFIKLQKAYDTLSDAEKRAAYDKKQAKTKTPETTPVVAQTKRRRFRISFFTGLVAVMGVIIVILLVRVLVSWSGGTPSATPAASSAGSQETSSPTPTDTPTDTPTPTPSPTATSTPTPTDTPSPSPTPTGEGILPTITPTPSVGP
jgi:cytoskeletal protein RodZ